MIGDRTRSLEDDRAPCQLAPECLPLGVVARPSAGAAELPARWLSPAGRGRLSELSLTPTSPGTKLNRPAPTRIQAH
jgi:hypothetical protein